MNLDLVYVATRNRVVVRGARRWRAGSTRLSSGERAVLLDCGPARSKAGGSQDDQAPRRSARARRPLHLFAARR